MIEDIAIYYSRWRLILVILGSLMFVTVGYLLLGGRGIVPLVGGLNIAFFGMCGACALWRLVWRAPALIISSEGIVDRTSIASIGLISWSQIQELKVITFRKQRFLGIFIDDPTAFIARQSILKRMALQSSLRLGGTPIAIPRVGLSIGLEELESIIRSRWSAVLQPPAASARGRQ